MPFCQGSKININIIAQNIGFVKYFFLDIFLFFQKMISHLRGHLAFLEKLLRFARLSIIIESKDESDRKDIAMIYKQFQERKLSALGMGCMRLPIRAGDSKQIDKDATRAMVAYAMEQGVNYFDTAWGYHGGASETVMGEILKEYPRDRFYLASKFPGYDLSNMEKIREVFEKQLQKCQVEYFDFYLVHNVCELNIDAYLDPKYGLLDCLLEQKKTGKNSPFGLFGPRYAGDHEALSRGLR